MGALARAPGRIAMPAGTASPAGQIIGAATRHGATGGEWRFAADSRSHYFSRSPGAGTNVESQNRKNRARFLIVKFAPRRSARNVAQAEANSGGIRGAKDE